MRFHAPNRPQVVTVARRYAALRRETLPRYRTKMRAEIETFGQPYYPKPLSSAAEGGIFRRVSQARFPRVAFCQISCAAVGILHCTTHGPRPGAGCCTRCAEHRDFQTKRHYPKAQAASLVAPRECNFQEWPFPGFSQLQSHTTCCSTARYTPCYTPHTVE